MNGPGPIFILSSARSGSTLARIILDTHPEIYSPPELDLGQMAHGLHRSIAWLEGTHGAPPAENRAALERTRAILSDLLEPYVRRKGKTIWCEKSPDNVRFRDLLAEVFPDARFLCLYRHALDVAHSCLETYRHGFPRGFQDYLLRSPGDHIQAVLDYWTDTASWTLEVERSHPARAFRFRYEDLVADPGGTLAPLFGFLGLAWDPSLLASVFGAEHDRGPGDPYVYFTDRIRQDSVGAGRNLPTGALPDPLRERLQKLLAELGYPERPERPERLQPAAASRQGATQAAGAAGDHGAPGDASPVGAAEDSGAAGDGAIPDARWLFETLLPARAASGGPPATPFACDVAVLGPGGGTWAIAWDDNGLRVSSGQGGLPARIELDAADLLDIVSGRENPLKIAQTGRIRVEGLKSDETLRGLLQLIWAPSAPAAGGELPEQG